MVALSKHVFQQAAEDQDFAIIDDNGRLDDALIGDQINGARGGLRNIRDLLGNIEYQ